MLASSVLARLRFLPRLFCVSGPLELAFPSSTLLLVTISRISLPYSSTENLSMVAVENVCLVPAPVWTEIPFYGGTVKLGACSSDGEGDEMR